MTEFMTLLVLIAPLVSVGCHPAAVAKPPEPRTEQPGLTIEFLPADDLLYKIRSDLGFEDWNFGARLVGSRDITDMNRLIVRHF